MIATPPRAELEEQAMRLARITASRFQRRDMHTVDKDDIQGAAYLGAAKALATFDPARGVKFSSYAIAVIKGEIREEMRRWDHLFRSDRGRARAEETATGEYPQWAAAHARLDGEFWSSADPSQMGQEPILLGDTLRDPDADTSRDALARVSHEEILHLIGWLPERERWLIHERYVLDRPFSELLLEWHRTESRLYQTHRAAIRRLRAWAKEGLVAL